MSSSLGAMGPLLRKLDSLLAPEYQLPKPLKDGIELLKEDLEEISAALVEQSMVDSPGHKAKYWMDEVRELSYDIEDCIDSMIPTHADADAKIGPVHNHKLGRVKIARLSRTPKPCTRIAELRTLVREASERHKRYQLDGCTSSSRSEFTGHGRVPSLYSASANFPVGVDDSKMKLIEWLTNEMEPQLKVVHIVGSAGVGKTTLARQLYRELGGQFERCGFVRASRKPDMRRLLLGVLSQVQRRQQPSDGCTVQNLIDDVREHLQDKRYFI